MLEFLREAAEARAVALASADRPKQRSSSGEAIDRHVRTASHFEVRESAEAGGTVGFAGYASMTEQPYEMYDFFGPYTEIVSQGAFAQTLGSNPNVPLVLQHDPLRRVASTANETLTLLEDGTGLRTEAELDPDDPDVQYILPKLRSGLIDEMSFKFDITASQWSPDYTELRINAVDIDRGDVSIVAFGANPFTTAGLRSKSLTDLIREADDEELQRAQRKIAMRLRDRGGKPAMTLEQVRLAAID